MRASVSSIWSGRHPAVAYYGEEDVKKPSFPDRELQEKIKHVIKTGIFSGKDGQIVPVEKDGKTVFLTGTGKKKKLTGTKIRIITKSVMDSPLLSSFKKVQFLPVKGMEKETAEGVVIGGYKWEKHITKKKHSLEEAVIIAKDKKNIEDSIKICENVNFARDLVNENADDMNSVIIEKIVKESISESKDCEIRVINEKEMRKLGMNLLLAVNNGSQYPPKLIIVKYNGGKKNEKYTALIGKGITYDSGGLGLKPSEYMRFMRDDMGGVAALIGTLRNVLEFKPKKNLIFGLPIAENAIDGKSYKTGAIIKSYSGKTVEIIHTDAEGRLILADAISYIDEKYKPETIIDMATLTGAAIIALGNDYSALMSDDDKLAKALEESGKKTDDRTWRLPIYPELIEHLKSENADIKNLGIGRTAGTISAGEFLRQFKKNAKKWAHIDIAGPVFIDEGKHWYYSHGATGAGVRLLTDFLLKK